MPVGCGYRDLAFEELDDILQQELRCSFCGEAFTPEDYDPHDLGQLVYYGQDEKGHRKVWHWCSLALKILIICKGHQENAAEILNICYLTLLPLI